MLLFARGAELSVNEVAAQAGIGQSTASQQLDILRRGGIVISRREGKTVLYRADKNGASAALSDLQDLPEELLLRSLSSVSWRWKSKCCVAKR